MSRKRGATSWPGLAWPAAPMRGRPPRRKFSVSSSCSSFRLLQSCRHACRLLQAARAPSRPHLSQFSQVLPRRRRRFGLELPPSMVGCACPPTVMGGELLFFFFTESGLGSFILRFLDGAGAFAASSCSSTAFDVVNADEDAASVAALTSTLFAACAILATLSRADVSSFPSGCHPWPKPLPGASSSSRPSRLNRSSGTASYCASRSRSAGSSVNTKRCAGLPPATSATSSSAAAAFGPADSGASMTLSRRASLAAAAAGRPSACSSATTERGTSSRNLSFCSTLPHKSSRSTP